MATCTAVAQTPASRGIDWQALRPLAELSLYPFVHYAWDLALEIDADDIDLTAERRVRGLLRPCSHGHCRGEPENSKAAQHLPESAFSHQRPHANLTSPTIK